MALNLGAAKEWIMSFITVPLLSPLRETGAFLEALEAFGDVLP